MKKNHPQPKIKRIVITFCWDPPPALIYTFPHHLQALKQASTVITSHPELTVLPEIATTTLLCTSALQLHILELETASSERKENQNTLPLVGASASAGSEKISRCEGEKL